MKVDQKLIEQIIPKFSSANWKESQWFDNSSILQKLSSEELKQVEKLLIEKMEDDDDQLIPETLVKIQSTDSVPFILKKILLMDDPFEKIAWASFMNDLIEGHAEAEEIAFSEFQKLEFIYEIQGSIFMSLVKFRSQRINDHIKTFINHKYSLVAYHAKLAINYKGISDDYYKNYYDKKRW
jgi:hypothetical protein